MQGVGVMLTIWGDKAKEDDAQWQVGSVLGVKNCKISDYNGVSLITLRSSKLVLKLSQFRRHQIKLILQYLNNRKKKLSII